MVTAIKTAERTSIHAGKGKTDGKTEGKTSADAEKESARLQGEHAKAASTAVDAAIKIRSESFQTLATGAAHALWFFANYGRTDYINRLFIGLLKGPSHTDADNLRTMYIPRLIELYGVGGQKDPEDETKWLRRNTPFVAFTTEGEKTGEFFKPMSFKDGDVKSDHVKKARQAIAAETVETLAAIAWKAKSAVTAPDKAYDREGFMRDLKRVLIKGAKATGDEESGINIATIEAIMRDAAMPRAVKSDIREAFSADQTQPQKAANTSETEAPKTEIPAEHASQKQQAAA